MRSPSRRPQPHSCGRQAEAAQELHGEEGPGGGEPGRGKVCLRDSRPSGVAWARHSDDELGPDLRPDLRPRQPWKTATESPGFTERSRT